MERVLPTFVGDAFLEGAGDALEDRAAGPRDLSELGEPGRAQRGIVLVGWGNPWTWGVKQRDVWVLVLFLAGTSLLDAWK